MASTLTLPPLLLTPQLLLRGTTGVTLLPALADLARLLDDFLLRMGGAGAGGRKHTHAKTRTRNQAQQKWLKPIRNFDHCQACGRVILPGHFCPYCLSYITRQIKGAVRAGLDRPTLDDKGLFITRQPDLERMPEHEYARFQKSTLARKYKWDEIKAAHEASEARSLKRVNARRAELGLPLKVAEKPATAGTGTGTVVEAAPPTPSLFQRMRARLPGGGGGA